MSAEQALAALREEAGGCRLCPLWKGARQLVFGEGPAPADLMLVGEQPGDQEDIQGRPFVGPAGHVLDRALAAAGLERSSAYVTNAVKHFKFTSYGRRRIHQKPDRSEIDRCRFWLLREIEIVDPRLIVAMGVTAARGVLGRTITIRRERGRFRPYPPDREVYVTIHPSFVLRIEDETAAEAALREFVEDLRRVRMRLEELGGRPRGSRAQQTLL